MDARPFLRLRQFIARQISAPRRRPGPRAGPGDEADRDPFTLVIGDVPGIADRQAVLGLDHHAEDLGFVGVQARCGRSSAKARPCVVSLSGSHPLIRSESGVSVAVPRVRSQISGPTTGRGGGSSSGVPNQI